MHLIDKTADPPHIPNFLLLDSYGVAGADGLKVLNKIKKLKERLDAEAHGRPVASGPKTSASLGGSATSAAKLDDDLDGKGEASHIAIATPPEETPPAYSQNQKAEEGAAAAAAAAVAAAKKEAEEAATAAAAAAKKEAGKLAQARAEAAQAKIDAAAATQASAEKLAKAKTEAAQAKLDAAAAGMASAGDVAKAQAEAAQAKIDADAATQASADEAAKAKEGAAQAAAENMSLLKQLEEFKRKKAEDEMAAAVALHKERLETAKLQGKVEGMEKQIEAGKGAASNAGGADSAAILAESAEMAITALQKELECARATYKDQLAKEARAHEQQLFEQDARNAADRKHELEEWKATTASERQRLEEENETDRKAFEEKNKAERGAAEQRVQDLE